MIDYGLVRAYEAQLLMLQRELAVLEWQSFVITWALPVIALIVGFVTYSIYLRRRLVIVAIPPDPEDQLIAELKRQIQAAEKRSLQRSSAAIEKTRPS